MSLINPAPCADALPDAAVSRFSPGAVPVTRLMCASQSRIDGSVYTEMERIRGLAVPRNAAGGVHTALLHQSGWFLQWREGPRDALDDIMARVQRDQRHQHLRVVHHSVGRRTLPGRWSMGMVQCKDSAEDFGLRVDRACEARERDLQGLPAAAWRALSSPLRGPGGSAVALAGQAGFQRVLVCSAEGDDAFTLVHRLAVDTVQDVVVRRFAGPSRLDVGTDYVDIPDAGRMLRVIAMARNGLGLGLTRAFLADYSHLVLLFSANDTHDEQLFVRVLQACAGLPAVPVILGVGASAAVNTRHFSHAHRLGLCYIDAALHAPVAALWPGLSAQLRIETPALAGRVAA
jgi:hypothetical protein